MLHRHNDAPCGSTNSYITPPDPAAAFNSTQNLTQFLKASKPIVQHACPNAIHHHSIHLGNNIFLHCANRTQCREPINPKRSICLAYGEDGAGERSRETV